MRATLAPRLHSRATSASRATAAADPDGELVDRFRAGDRTAFDLLVRRYQRRIFALAFRYLANEADAKDVTQQTFIKVFKSLSGFKKNSSLRTWIYRIAVNSCLNHVRDHRKAETTEVTAELVVTEPTGASRLIADEHGQRLRDAIAELPPKQKMVLELRIYDELKFREVAELAGCSENAAKVNFHHAVTHLRGVLRDPPRGRNND